MNAASFAVLPLLHSEFSPGTNPFQVIKMFSKQKLNLQVQRFLLSETLSPTSFSKVVFFVDDVNVFLSSVNRCLQLQLLSSRLV